jgi:asparagine synthase (glutamine-hydrolysing)
MPGTNILASENPLTPPASSLWEWVQKGMLHWPDYSFQQLFKDPLFHVGFTAYASYPKTIVETEEHFVVLEGMIYNADAGLLRAELQSMARQLSLPTPKLVDSLARFLNRMDGEFVVTAFDKGRKRLVVFNDVLGRLPLFYHLAKDSLVVSREVKFLIPFLPSLAFSASGIMEYLLYGFPFRENTLVQEAFQLPPATVLSYDLATGVFEKKEICKWSFDGTTKGGTREEIVAQLKHMFLEIVKERTNQIKDRTTFVSLSGGMDSRGVLGALRKSGASPIAATVDGPERHYAERVARAVGAEIHLIPPAKADWRPWLKRVVFLKDGLDCHPGLVDLHSYLENLAAQFGRDSIYFSGIGGEITRKAHLTSGLRSQEDLVTHLRLNGGDASRCSPEQVAFLLGHEEKLIQQHVKEWIEEFPERDVYKKYLRFGYEYNFRYAGGGEDRNRFYFWTISPYYSYRFFSYAMSIPENQKDLRLFRDMLFAIDPRLCSVPYYNFRIPLDRLPLLYVLSAVQRLVRIILRQSFSSKNSALPASNAPWFKRRRQGRATATGGS